MSQDIISDGLNQIMNAKRSKKNKAVIRVSRFFIDLLKLAKDEGYITDYREDDGKAEVEFKLNECRAIKPRFNVTSKEIEKYMRRYLPSRHMGVIFVSTSSGLMTHRQAIEKGLGGCLIAYFF